MQIPDHTFNTNQQTTICRCKVSIHLPILTITIFILSNSDPISYKFAIRFSNKQSNPKHVNKQNQTAYLENLYTILHMAISTHHHHHRNNLNLQLHPHPYQHTTSASSPNYNYQLDSTGHGSASKFVRMRVCFSFAAYAKSLIDHLITNCNVLVHQGLTDDEFQQIETALAFRFPPDLRSILREGLPVGAGFPNWRSASKQQLQVLIKLPILGICKSVRYDGFWMNGWGVKPMDKDRAVEVAEMKLRSAPVLIPVYKTFYIPSEPNMAGNPVFEVVGGDVKMAGFDIAGFFERRVEFSDRRVMAPAWKATEARKIEMWTEMAEAERGGSGGWWWRRGGGEFEFGFEKGLEDAFWRLRDGGWDVDEVMEMMRMDGQDYMDKC